MKRSLGCQVLFLKLSCKVGTRALELRGGRVMEVAWLVQVMQLRGSLGIKPGSSDAAAAAFPSSVLMLLEIIC